MLGFKGSRRSKEVSLIQSHLSRALKEVRGQATNNLEEGEDHVQRP